MDNSSMKKVHYAYAAGFIVLGALCIGAANYFDLWWFTILMGIIPGVLFPYARLALPISLLTGGLGWGGCLVYQSFFLPVLPAANVIAGIMGFGNHSGWLLITITIVLGVILAGCGTWVSVALKSLVTFIMVKRMGA